MCSRHPTSLPMEHILISCDLGENEPDEQTFKLLEMVDAASICCGTHAGSLSKTRKTLNCAKSNRVLIGAHPGLSEDGGRGEAIPDADHFGRILDEQMMAFLDCADRIETWVSYIKLHGSLYHAVEIYDELAEVYLNALRHTGSGFSVFARSGGRFQEMAKSMGVRVRKEIFADRGYCVDGTLVPRSEEGALLDVESALFRFQKWCRTGLMDTVDGGTIELAADTVCVHSDSPDAVTLVMGLRRQLGTSQ